ncbi:hypothetical protein A2U01_0119352, partial [Trifolium medium]|nr:hypothetical protein [Trifolium medium]
PPVPLVGVVLVAAMQIVRCWIVQFGFAISDGCFFTLLPSPSIWVNSFAVAAIAALDPDVFATG